MDLQFIRCLLHEIKCKILQKHNRTVALTNISYDYTTKKPVNKVIDIIWKHNNCLKIERIFST